MCKAYEMNFQHNGEKVVHEHRRQHQMKIEMNECSKCLCVCVCFSICLYWKQKKRGAEGTFTPLHFNDVVRNKFCYKIPS